VDCSPRRASTPGRQTPTGGRCSRHMTGPAPGAREASGETRRRPQRRRTGRHRSGLRRRHRRRPRTSGGDPMRLLSLGAGVQSTTLALLAVEGRLPSLDGAIFADTGWEPRTVYEHLDRLEKVLADAGIPLHRVSAGNLRRDLLDPDARYGSIPYYVSNPDGSEGMGRRQCTQVYKLAPINRRVRELLGAAPPDFRRVPKGRT